MAYRIGSLTDSLARRSALLLLQGGGGEAQAGARAGAGVVGAEVKETTGKK